MFRAMKTILDHPGEVRAMRGVGVGLQQSLMGSKEGLCLGRDTRGLSESRGGTRSQDGQNSGLVWEGS